MYVISVRWYWYVRCWSGVLTCRSMLDVIRNASVSVHRQIRLDILTALATPTTSEVIALNALMHISNPLIHKWCAHINNDTIPIAVQALVMSMFIVVSPMLMVNDSIVMMVNESVCCNREPTRRTYTSGWPNNQNICSHITISTLSTVMQWSFIWILHVIAIKINVSYMNCVGDVYVSVIA